MDLVRDRIKQLGGTVDLKFETGRSCTFTIRLPLKANQKKKTKQREAEPVVS
jgi:chemotaxis protein histidine kinase CheA